MIDEYVDSIVDSVAYLRRYIDSVISNHKAVVETMHKDHKNKIWHKDQEVNLVRGENDQLRRKIATMQNKIEGLESINKEMRNCDNCNPLDIFDCEDCKYIENGESDNWIAKGIK